MTETGGCCAVLLLDKGLAKASKLHSIKLPPFVVQGLPSGQQTAPSLQLAHQPNVHTSLTPTHPPHPTHHHTSHKHQTPLTAVRQLARLLPARQGLAG